MEENKKNKKTLLVLLLLLLLGVALVLVYIFSKPKTGPFKLKSPDGPVDTSKPGVYEDDRIKLGYPAGWERKDIDDAQLKGVQLTKAQYVFTVISNFVQASGVEGGKFSEIAAQVAPWISANDAMSCITHLNTEDREVARGVKLHNLYFAPSSASSEVKSQCGKPTIGGVLWYGSYFADNGYFIGNPGTGEIIAAISYAVKSADQVPYKGDSNLQHILEEASTMIKEMQIKNPTTVQ